MDISSMKVSDPEKLKLEVTFTATLSEWRKLREQMPSGGQYPSMDLRIAICDMIVHAEKHFFSPSETTNG